MFDSTADGTESSGASPRAAALRRRTRIVAGALVCSVAAVALYMYSARQSAKPLAASSIAGLSADTDNDDSSYTIEMDMSQLSTFSSIRSFIVNQTGSAPEELASYELGKYVPSRIRIQGWPKRIQQNIGSKAEGGFVVFAIQNHVDDETNSASYMMMVDLKGEIRQIYPHILPEMCIDAVKPWDSTSLLMLGSRDYSQWGPAYHYDWTTGIRSELAGARPQDSHDAQRGYGVNSDVLWRIHGKNSEYTPVEKVDAFTGEVLHIVYLNDTLGSMPGLNHLQLIEQDTLLVINARDQNVFAKVRVNDSTVLWQAGGGHGTLDLIDVDGVRYNVSTTEYEALNDGTKSLWVGSHNLEYVGNNEFLLFNNAHDHTTDDFVSNTSSLMTVRVDEAAQTATVVWEYKLPYQQEVYGDNDRLPSGNFLSVGWPWEFSARENIDFDMEVFEVVERTKERAWEFKVWGESTTRTGSDGNNTGWMVYSAERVYEEPIISHITCRDSILEFHTHNNFKQSDSYPGRWTVYAADDELLLGGVFLFEPYWQPSTVRTAHQKLQRCAQTTCTVQVTNQFEDKGWETFTCS